MPRGQVGRARQAARLAELIKSIAYGNEAGFTELYDETSSRVYGAALQMLRSPRLAAEVTEEVYVEIWQQASHYDPSSGSVLAWMMAVTHGRAVARVRAVSKESASERHASLNGGRELRRVSDEAEARLDADEACEAMRSLTDTQRQAVTLAYFGGCSQTEVARLLGLPLGAVKLGIKDGLIGLRNALGVGT